MPQAITTSRNCQSGLVPVRRRAWTALSLRPGGLRPMQQGASERASRSHPIARLGRGKQTSRPATACGMGNTGACGCGIMQWAAADKTAGRYPTALLVRYLGPTLPAMATKARMASGSGAIDPVGQERFCAWFVFQRNPSMLLLLLLRKENDEVRRPSHGNR